MSLPNFKTHIKLIRKEAIEIGFNIKTMDEYQTVWNNFIKWKNEDDFLYSSEDYNHFLFDWYCFDVSSYTKKSKSHHQFLMRSKRILEDFDYYKIHMEKTMFPKSLFNSYPSSWNITIEKFLDYSRNIKLNSESSIKFKRDYLIKELSYFFQKGLHNLSDFSNKNINQYIVDTISAGNVSKRRNFHVLREFLKYLFIENITNEDLSFYVPKIKRNKRTRIPTYLKQTEIEKLLNKIPKETNIEKRDYTIILIAARLGLRISDILNIKLKDIDWINHKLNVIQHKTNNLNVLPLSKEVGWAIIDYIKVRPKCENEYLFLKAKYPFEKLQKFYKFNKYFGMVELNLEEKNKNGIHNLRHSLAKNMLDNEIPIEIISSTLGHSNIDTTYNTYLKIDVINLKKCVLEVEE